MKTSSIIIILKKILLFFIVSAISVFANADDHNYLIRAIYNKNYTMIKELILSGVDMDAKNSDGYCAWDYIDGTQTLDTIKRAFLEKKLPQDVLNHEFEQFFKNTSKDGHCFMNKLEVLIYAGADVNYIFMPEKTTALFFAFSNKYWGENTISHPQFIDGILKAGIEVNQQDSVGRTALMHEIETRKKAKTYIVDRINILLKHGADVNIKDNNGVTALTMARVLTGGESLISKTLVEAGAKHDLTEEWWYTLHTLWDKPDFGLRIEELVRDGVDVNLQATCDMFMQSPDRIEGNGQTALMFVAGRQMQYRINNLIKLDADIDIKDNNGRTALHYLALSSHDYDYYKEDEKYYYDDDYEGSCNYENYNVPEWEKAFENMHDSLKSNLNASAKDDYGKTAFDYAVNNQPVLAKVIYRRSSDDDKVEMDRTFFSLFTKEENKVVQKFISKYEFVRKKQTDRLPDRIYNELWWESEVHVSAVSGTNYFFSESGKFNYKKYYSGGVYFRTIASGIYKYNEKAGEIVLKIKYKTEGSPIVVTPSILYLSNITDDTVMIGDQYFNKSKNTTRFFLYDTDEIQIDTMKLSAYINDKPFCSTSIKQGDYESIVNYISLKGKWRKRVRREDIENEIKIFVTIIEDGYKNKYFTIWPELDLIECYNNIYTLKNKSFEKKQFKRILSSYLKN